MADLDAIVVGAGLSGLTAAWRLQQAGRSVRVLEAESFVGGNTGTYTDRGYRLERGPHSFMASAENVWRLLEDLGVDDRAITASAVGDNRYVYRDGRLIPLPLSVMKFIASPLLSLRAKLRLMTEPFRKSGAKPSDTALEFFHRRFGVEATTYMAGVFVSGIYAGDPARLGARAAFPKFWDFENEHGSMIRGAFHYMRQKKKRLLTEGRKTRKGLFSFADGLGFMANTLAERLGDAVKTGVRVAAVEKCDRGWRVRVDGETFEAASLILATPPHVTSRLLSTLDVEISALLDGIPMASVAVVHVGGPSDQPVVPGFGALIPRHTKLRTLGILFPSQLFPNRAPEGRFLHTSFIGGMFDPEAASLSDEALVEIAQAEQTRLLGVTRFDYAGVLKYSHGIPQLLPDHPERIAALRVRIARHQGLHLAGNYLTGVGVDHAVGSGDAAAAGCLNDAR